MTKNCQFHFINLHFSLFQLSCITMHCQIPFPEVSHQVAAHQILRPWVRPRHFRHPLSATTPSTTTAVATATTSTATTTISVIKIFTHRKMEETVMIKKISTPASILQSKENINPKTYHFTCTGFHRQIFCYIKYRWC